MFWANDALKKIIQVLSLTRIFTRKAERDVHYFIYLSPAVAMAGVLALLVQRHTARPGIAVEVGVVCLLALIPGGLYLATSTWRARLNLTFPAVAVDRYLNFHEVAYQDYQRDLQAISDAALPSSEDAQARLAALARYQDSSSRIRDALIPRDQSPFARKLSP